MSAHWKALQEKKARAAERRLETGDQNVAPARTNNIFGGAVTSPKPGKRQPAPARATRPFADHDVADRRAPAAAAPYADDGRAPTPQKQAQLNARRGAGVSPRRASGASSGFGPSQTSGAKTAAQRHAGGDRTDFFTGGGQSPAAHGGKRAYRQASTSGLIGGVAASPVAYAPDLAPDVASGLSGQQRAYAERANQARGACRGPRSGASSYGGCNGPAAARLRLREVDRCNGGQNVGNSMGDRNSSRVLAPPGGFSSISFG